MYGEIRWGLNMGFCLLGNMRKGDSSGSDGDQFYTIWVIDFRFGEILRVDSLAIAADGQRSYS